MRQMLGIVKEEVKETKHGETTLFHNPCLFQCNLDMKEQLGGLYPTLTCVCRAAPSGFPFLARPNGIFWKVAITLSLYIV